VANGPTSSDKPGHGATRLPHDDEAAGFRVQRTDWPRLLKDFAPQRKWNPLFSGAKNRAFRRWRGAATMARAKRKKTFDLHLFLSTVSGGRTESSYRKRRTIFAQGDVADSIFFLQNGQVKLSVLSAFGKEAVVALHQKGDFFGEGCLSGQPLRLATAVAITDCAVMKLEMTTVVRLLREEPKFAEAFLSYILARNARIEEDLVDQLFNSSEKRLARLLLLMANFGKEGRPEPVIVKLSQETLAEMVGTTRSRVSSFMNKFRKLGFIDYNGDLEVRNSLLNVILHDNPGLKR